MYTFKIKSKPVFHFIPVSKQESQIFSYQDILEASKTTKAFRPNITRVLFYTPLCKAKPRPSQL